MKKIDKEAMKEISGGAFEWNGSIFTSFIKYLKLIFEIGQALGSASRRDKNNNYCRI